MEQEELLKVLETIRNNANMKQKEFDQCDTLSGIQNATKHCSIKFVAICLTQLIKGYEKSEDIIEELKNW